MPLAAPWRSSSYDAVVVGAGPNGLAAAIELAQTGLSVLVVEAKETAGGGARTGQITLPGFHHDICSAVHPFGIASPFFTSLHLDRHGLEWVQPPAPLAHVLGDGRAVLLERSVEATAEHMGADNQAYRDLMSPFVEASTELLSMILAGPRFPTSPLLFARFGLQAMRSMRDLARSRFSGEEAPALLAGIAAHAVVPLEEPATASFALALAVAGHALGWPVARGGSQSIIAALVRVLEAEGGEVVTGHPVLSIDRLPKARAYLFDVSPRQLLEIAGDRLSSAYRRRLSRFRHAPGAFKVDWALQRPIPWRDPACLRAATVHLGGDLERISRSEAAVHAGHSPREPFVLVVQPSLFDETRAPTGRHTAWAYCHLPPASTFDATSLIEGTIEAAAPGFREVVLARRSSSPADLEKYNPNYIGGDIGGGAADLASSSFGRPTASTPMPRRRETFFSARRRRRRGRVSTACVATGPPEAPGRRRSGGPEFGRAVRGGGRPSRSRPPCC